jgi:hypothetical protein
MMVDLNVFVLILISEIYVDASRDVIAIGSRVFSAKATNTTVTEPCLGGVLPPRPCAGFFGVHTRGPVSLCIPIQAKDLDLVLLSQEIFLLSLLFIPKPRNDSGVCSSLCPAAPRQPRMPRPPSQVHPEMYHCGLI